MERQTMKMNFPRLLISIISLSVAFGVTNKVPKGEKMKYKIEPSPLQSGGHHGSTPIVFPNTGSARNGSYITLIDSSANGYGLISSNTRPLYVDEEGNWFIAYRQYCGQNTTHGQLGGAYSDDDGDSWETYTNLNYNGNPPWGGGGQGGIGTAQAQYPNALVATEWPVAIWNEYTGGTSNGSLYGGRPYSTFEENVWFDHEFSYPVELGYYWETSAKDLWVGSAAVSGVGDTDMDVINVVFSDWTRGDKFLFHSEAIDEDIIIWGEEKK